MTRDARADGSKFARQAAADACAPLPLPPKGSKLTREQRRYWPVVLGAKRPGAWTESDLIFAVQLCRDMAAIEQLARDMVGEDLIYEDKRGVKRPHPGQALQEQLCRRAASLARLLQIHSAATNGLSHHQRDKNATQRKIGAIVFEAAEFAPDLIPIPGSTMQ